MFVLFQIRPNSFLSRYLRKKQINAPVIRLPCCCKICRSFSPFLTALRCIPLWLRSLLAGSCLADGLYCLFLWVSRLLRHTPQSSYSAALHSTFQVGLHQPADSLRLHCIPLHFVRLSVHSLHTFRSPTAAYLGFVAPNPAIPSCVPPPPRRQLSHKPS